MSHGEKENKKHIGTLLSIIEQNKALYDNQEPYDLKPWSDLSRREKSREVARCVKVIKARRIIRKERFNQDEVDDGLKRLRVIKRHIENMGKQLDSAHAEYAKLHTLSVEDSWANGPLASEVRKISDFAAFNAGGAIKDTALQLGWMIDDVSEFREESRPRTSYKEQKAAFQMAYQLANTGRNKKEVEGIALRITDELGIPPPDVDTAKGWRKEEKTNRPVKR